ncbi:MAG: fibronectin type III domain-containing protein [Clostridiales Family XIII bacterium]|nr:fibronectin type III domain-containing protein [Clostridiales Family XIII bacterium]
MGQYSGSITVPFKIVPKKPTSLKLTTGKRTLTVSFKKVSKSQKVIRYKVQYRIKGSATWKTKVVKVKLTGKTAKQKRAKITLKKLKAGRTYEVRVYAYKGSYPGAPTTVKRKYVK